MRRSAFWATLFWVLALSTTAFGQLVSVSGAVRDASGAVMPGTTVTLRRGNEKTRTAQTDVYGKFAFDRVSPGLYELVAEHDGFKPATNHVTVGNRPPRAVEFKLEIAGLKQEITVADDSQQVSTQTGNNLDVASLNRNELDNVPIFDGDYIATISRFLDAGAVGSGGATLIMDGLQVNSVSLPASAIQEVKINQNPYSPEFLRPGRGRIEVVTRPGASAYHGTFNFVFRDNRLNAREPFALTRPPEQKRDFETSLTGPLGSGKTSSFMVSGSYHSESAQAIVFAVGPSGPILGNFPAPQRSSDFSARITHQFGEKNTVSLRYEGQDQYQKGQGVGGVNLPESARSFRHREDAFTYTQTTAFSAKLVNAFSILFGKEYEPTRSALQAPKIVVLDAFVAGGSQSDRLITEYHTQFHDALTLVRGRHTIKMGVDVPDISRRGLEDHSNFLGTFTFSSLEDYRLNRPFSFIQQAGDGKVIFWEKVLSEFFVDDIRLRPNLTLSLAARYDWQNYFHDRNNLSPRLAFAFSPARHPNTVFRGGAGFFYDRTGAGPIYDLLRYDGAHLMQAVVTNPEYPDPWSNGVSAPSAPPSIVKLAPDVRIPYLLQFGIGVERQLRKSTTLTVNYTGSAGVGMFRSRDINAPLPPSYDGRRDPAFSVVRQIESSGRLETQSLDVAVRGAITRFYSGMVQYTLSRAYNDTSGIGAFPANSYDLSGEWSRADFDQRHRFNVLGTMRAGKFINLGAGISLNTGRPYSLTTGRDDYHTGLATARPPGVPRNSAQGPGYASVDLRWYHDFKLAPPRNEVAPTMSVALDAFNITNRVNYTGYVGNLSSPLFGKPVSAQPPRRLQLSARFAF